MPIDDPILDLLRVALHEEYGTRLERAVLYGSRARGDARVDSDYDVAVFLTESRGLWQESEPLSRIGMAILIETGAVINALAFPSGAHAKRTPLMHEVRRDGVEL